MERAQTARNFVAEEVAERDSSANPSKASASMHSNEGGGYSPSLTRMVSNKSPNVPRNKRRGMFAQLALVPEIEDPRGYGKFIKYLITTLVGAAGSTGPMAGTILFRKFLSSLGGCARV